MQNLVMKVTIAIITLVVSDPTSILDDTKNTFDIMNGEWSTVRYANKILYGQECAVYTG